MKIFATKPQRVSQFASSYNVDGILFNFVRGARTFHLGGAVVRISNNALAHFSLQSRYSEHSETASLSIYHQVTCGIACATSTYIQRSIYIHIRTYIHRDIRGVTGPCAHFIDLEGCPFYVCIIFVLLFYKGADVILINCSGDNFNTDGGILDGGNRAWDVGV